MSAIKSPKDSVIVFSDVSKGNDGVGVEIYRDGKCIMTIFRDDSKKTRTITPFMKEIPLSIMEECIAIFKKEIPWDFID
jgi:hypothetical protein